MREFWNRLQVREQRTLMGGAAALALLLVYWLAVDPYLATTRNLEQRVAEQRELLRWMSAAADEVQRLRGADPDRPDTGGGSLLTIVDHGARAQGLGKALQRVQPDGGAGVQVWLETAPFDALLRWLDQLEGDYGIRVTGLVLEAEDAPGRVTARITLRR